MPVTELRDRASSMRPLLAAGLVALVLGGCVSMQDDVPAAAVPEPLPQPDRIPRRPGNPRPVDPAAWPLRLEFL